jgi:tetratricopeptide (TPR) repeat protein
VLKAGARRRPQVVGIALSVTLLLAGASALAATPSEISVIRANELARAGNCREAIVRLEGVDTGPAAMLRGQCYLQLQQYPDAVKAFEDAKRIDPKLPDVDLDLAMARFHQGDLQGAREALDAAAPTSSSRPEYQLYEGLLLLEQAKSKEAAAELARAQQTGPQLVDPIASYYEGLAWGAAEDADKAEAALDRVIAAAPGTPWAEAAEKAKAELRRGGQPVWWAWVRGGVEYDTNVVLRGNDVATPQNISHQSDTRGVWEFHGGAQLWRTRNWAAGVHGAYYGSAEVDLTQFNEHYPTLGAWLDRRLTESDFLRLRYDLGYAWVDQGPYMFNHGGGPEYFHDWGRGGQTKLFFSAFSTTYFFQRVNDVPAGTGGPGSPCPPGVTVCGPMGLNENAALNRNGWGLYTGVDHSIPVDSVKTTLSGGYHYYWYNSLGNEYQFQGHELWLGTDTALPWRTHLRLWGSFTYFPFYHASVFPDPKDVAAAASAAPPVEYSLQSANRRDSVWGFRAEIEKYLTDQLAVSVAYYYTNDESNVAVYDYDRGIVGAYVTYHFNR